jgi:serine/threonine-protein kinase
MTGMGGWAISPVEPGGLRIEHTTPTSRIVEVRRGSERGLCKRLAPRAAEEAWMRELLAAEGRVLAHLGGQGAPGLIDAGEDAAGPWLVMELVDAAPLLDRLHRADARDPAWTAAATQAVFEALAMVHARDVLHSDLSPANVLVAPDCRVMPDPSGHAGNSTKLIDFGLARWSGAPPLPQGPFRGTLLYAAPELARGEPIDARADLFAAAASLLHVYSGEAPRSQTSAASMLLSAGDEPIEGWAERASEGLPRLVREAVRSCCAFDRAHRPASARELVRL